MNYRLVRRLLGLLLIVLSTVILLVAGFAAVERARGDVREGPACLALLMAGGLGALVGAVMWRWGTSGDREELGRREALLLVTCSWLLGAALAAVPYRVWASLAGPTVDVNVHEFGDYVNCYFESMSGLTTTGATVLTAIGTVPRSLLLWRALTHWLGGLGIIVLFVAVLPMLGVGGRRLFRVEAPGPAPEGVRPRIQDAARVLWMIYAGLTAAEIVALIACGMGPFDAVCHTFATLATGGFSTQDASIAAYASGWIHVVIIVFMVLAGVNFGLYHHVIRGNWRAVRRDAELRAYLSILVIACAVVVALCLVNRPAPMRDQAVGGIVRDVAFQVVSIQTTTGFCTADFDQWGFAAKAVLLTLMFIGGSAGSTGGGVKVIRVLIAGKVVAAELEHVFRPNVVRTVNIGGAIIDPQLKLGTLVYILGILACFALGTFALMVFERAAAIDITTAATAAAATLNNIGPGLARVGTTQNYAWFSDAGKIVMSILMAVGRLELFAVAVLFTPRFWRST